MPRVGQYTEEIRIYVTPEMRQFLQLMADRRHVSLSELLRQVAGQYLVDEEDRITSRSRLGRTVITALDKMQSRLLGDVQHISRLILAAMISIMVGQGMQYGEAAERIVWLANQPAIARMLEATKQQTETKEK